MQELGVFEAKTKFSEICSRVARSKKPLMVTLRGRPLVKIVPIEEASTESVWDARERFERTHGTLKEELVLPKRSKQTFRNVLET